MRWPPSTIEQRFDRRRWSETRRRIDAMTVGQVLQFNPDQYYNAKASVDRCNEAYEDREWSIKTHGGHHRTKRIISTVTRIR